MARRSSDRDTRAARRAYFGPAAIGRQSCATTRLNRWSKIVISLSPPTLWIVRNNCRRLMHTWLTIIAECICHSFVYTHSSRVTSRSADASLTPRRRRRLRRVIFSIICHSSDRPQRLMLIQLSSAVEHRTELHSRTSRSHARTDEITSN